MSTRDELEVLIKDSYYGDEITRGDRLNAANIAYDIIAAAEPHLRKKWEQPIWEFARKLARPFPDGVPDREGEAIAAELIDVLKGAGE